MPTSDPNPTGDLSSFPRADRWLWDEEIFALDQLITMAPNGPEVPIFRYIIHDRRQMLELELSERTFLTAIIRERVHHQLRCRSDHRESQIIVEQWVPAVNCWLVSGKFDLDATANTIVLALQAGDPRYKTAEETYKEAQQAATFRRAQIDAASDLRISDAIADLSSERLDQFIAVETALKTGETISARGDDRRFLERAEARTRDAAAHGDLEAQRVLTHGVQDSALCVNPGDNPTVR